MILFRDIIVIDLVSDDFSEIGVGEVLIIRDDGIMTSDIEENKEVGNKEFNHSVSVELIQR